MPTPGSVNLSCKTLFPIDRLRAWVKRMNIILILIWSLGYESRQEHVEWKVVDGRCPHAHAHKRRLAKPKPSQLKAADSHPMGQTQQLRPRHFEDQ